MILLLDRRKMDDEEETGGVTWSEFVTSLYADSLDRMSDDVRSVSSNTSWSAMMSPAVLKKIKQLRKQVRYKRKNRNT